MSIINCPRCSDSFDSDQHTEPLCKTCMGKVCTFESETVAGLWIAYDDHPVLAGVGVGYTEDEAIAKLVRPI